ncbi:MAG: zinc ABC transporter substrate-binding protein [Alistipes sp.]|nr:zinc ABC transporter substrate-binding protein [Alistipes sp.]
MKKTLYLFIYIALCICFTSCIETKKEVEKERIYVSIAPIKPLVEAIVGDDFDIEILVPAGASPETFEPTAKQFVDLNKSNLIFGIGLLDFEQELLKRIHNQNKVINLSHGITTISGSCSHTHHGEHCHHGVDPHIWCSPKSLSIMANNMHNAIVAAMPDSIQYTNRYNALNKQLTSLDIAVEQLCNNSPHPYFIIYHPALTYLARDYGLKQVAIENEGKEASAKRIAQIIDAARRDGIKSVFYQSEFPESSVTVIAEDIGAEAVEINPLAEDIFTNILNITTLITE